MTNGNEQERRIVTIRPPKGPAIRHEAWRYNSIVETLREYGAKREEAYKTTLWICRHAKPGDKKEIWPNIEIEVTVDDPT